MQLAVYTVFLLIVATLMISSGAQIKSLPLIIIRVALSNTTKVIVAVPQGYNIVCI